MPRQVIYNVYDDIIDDLSEKNSHMRMRNKIKTNHDKSSIPDFYRCVYYLKQLLWHRHLNTVLSSVIIIFEWKAVQRIFWLFLDTKQLH